MAEVPKISETHTGVTSPSLLFRVKSHDQEAWRRLVRLYSPLVAFWIQRSGFQEADADDVSQDVFQAVANGIEAFDKEEGGTFRGWLRILTRSKVVDHLRRRRGQATAEGGTTAQARIQDVECPLQDDADANEVKVVQQVRVRALDMIRNEFEARTWQMFWQVTVDDRSPKDVAGDMGVTAAAVRLAKSRVLRRLREELGELEP